MKGTPLTPTSVAQAKAYQQQERQHVEKETGLHVTDDPITVSPLFIVGCPQHGCGYAATARREGQAIRSLAAHIVHHLRRN